MEDMGADPVRDNGTTCAHPAIGAPGPAPSRRSPTDQYATRHNPFVYFHSIIDDAGACAQRDVPLDAARRPTSPRSRTTPNLSFIMPDLCHDGHDAMCADGGPGGLPAADAVPADVGAADHVARRRTSATACSSSRSTRPRTTRAPAVASSPGRTRPAPGGQNGGPGGGRTGAVLLSPSIAPGTRRLVRLQPLQPAAQHRGPLRAAASRLRGARPACGRSAPTSSRPAETQPELIVSRRPVSRSRGL